MKAVRIHQTGGPEVLQFEDVPTPVPGPDQVLIDVQSIGVNFMDIGRRRGGMPSQLPMTLGGEAAGIVSAIGENVRDIAVGDLVGSPSVVGGYAEQALAPAARTIKLPSGTDATTAAASLLQGMTAHALAYGSYPLKSQDKALVHAGAGGVGLLLIQMAKMLDAYVYATVSSDQKAEVAKQMGADKVIIYTQQDFAEVIAQDTAGQGVQVIYDSVGQVTFDQDIKCLGRTGSLVLYGSASGPIPPIDLAILSGKSLAITRGGLANYTTTREALLDRANDVLGWIASGQLKLRIHNSYNLADAAQAHRELEGRETIGKLLLIP